MSLIYSLPFTSHYHNIPIIANSIHCKLNNTPLAFKTDASIAHNLGFKDPQKQNYRNPDGQISFRPQYTNGFHSINPKSVDFEISECISVLNQIKKIGDSDSCSSACRQIHGHLVKLGELKIDSFVGNKLVVAYARDAELLNDAQKLFDEIPKREVFAYAALIGSLCRLEMWVDFFEVFGMMVNDGMMPDRFLVPTVLKACSVMQVGKVGKMVHGYVLRRGIGEDVFVGNALIDMYANCGELQLSTSVFETMSARDVVSWTARVVAYMVHGLMDEAVDMFRSMELDGVQADLISWNALASGFSQNGEIELALGTVQEMEEIGLRPKVNTWNGVISGCIHNGLYEDALDAYVKMFWSSLAPNVVTIVSILPACSDLKALNVGQLIHGHAIKLGLGGNTHINGSLIGMYWKCGRTDYADSLFSRMKHKNTATCNEMIAAYICEGNSEGALKLFDSMKLVGPKPDEITCNTLLAAYVRDGKKEKAYEMLCEMFDLGLQPNTITFNTLISGYQQSGYSHEALRIFQATQPSCSDSYLSSVIRKAIQPNTVTVTSALAACADVGSLHHGKELHGYVLRKGLESNIFVSCSLVDMYAKCRSINVAEEVFWRTRNKNTVLWNTLIAGYVHRKQITKAFSLLSRMLEEGFDPSPVTFKTLIPACEDIGALRFGTQVHGYLLKVQIDASDKFLASALIDMYAKCSLDM